jgi:hypothetical protein
MPSFPSSSHTIISPHFPWVGRVDEEAISQASVREQGAKDEAEPKVTHEGLKQREGKDHSMPGHGSRSLTLRAAHDTIRLWPIGANSDTFNFCTTIV